MTTGPSGHGGDSPPVSCSLNSLHNLKRTSWRERSRVVTLTSGAATSTPGISKPIQRAPTALQDRCNANARSAGPAPRVAAKCASAALAPRNPRKTTAGRSGYLSRPPDPLCLKSQVPGQGRRTPRTVVGGLRAGRRRRPMDGRGSGLAGWLAGWAGRGCGARPPPPLSRGLSLSLSPLRPRGL